jgi:hypothetical protein
MKRFRLVLICFILVLSASSAYAASGAPAPARTASKFAYKAFPSLPSATVAPDPFLVRLLEACELLVSIPKAALSAPESCTGAPAATTLPADLEAETKQARELPHVPTPLAACTPADRPSQVGANHFAFATLALQAACSKLYVAKPSVLLVKADVETLRAARDAPTFLPSVIAWAQTLKNEAQNPTIKKDANALQSALKVAEGAGAGPALPGTPSLGALSDQFIRGMAEFLQKRAQAEALRYLRKTLKNDLCEASGDEGALRKAVFRNVCAALDSLDNGMSLEAIGAYLRAAAEKDLRKLPDLALAYLEHLEPPSANATFSGRLGLAYYAAARNGRDPFEILYSLAELTAQSCESKNCKEVASTVRLASTIAYALRQGGSNWQDQFGDNLTAERRPLAAVAVLLLAEKRAAAPAVKASLTITHDLLNTVVLNPLELVSEALSMVRTWKALGERLKGNLSEEARREVLADAMEQGIGSITRMAEDVHAVLGSAAEHERIMRAAERTRDFVAVAGNLTRRNYGAAVVLTLEQIKNLRPQAKQSALFGKYLPLVVEIATAQSSNDVASAIDAAASPIGTYELKYQQPMLALNGIFGWTYGVERMSSKGVSGTNQATAAFAPIGLHLSRQLGDRLHGGLLLTVLDLGAVTAFKTSDDQPEGKLDGVDPMTMDVPKVSETPEITLEQVFSPGAYLVFGLLKTPIVIGGGVALAPSLREVRQDSLVEDVSVLRFGGFIGIDVPILPFSFN